MLLRYTIDRFFPGRTLQSQLENKAPDMSEFPALGARYNQFRIRKKIILLD